MCLKISANKKHTLYYKQIQKKNTTAEFLRLQSIRNEHRTAFIKQIFYILHGGQQHTFSVSLFAIN